MRQPDLPEFSPISRNLFADESDLVHALAAQARLDGDDAKKTQELAISLVRQMRRGRKQKGGVDEFMQEYSLSSHEGVVLMCLAEALLRIPDDHTADKLIADKIGGRDWEKHLGASDSLFVNASTWGLMLTGRFVDLGADAVKNPAGYFSRIVKRSGEPVVRQAMRHAMRIMGKQFVLGRTIGEALDVSKPLKGQGYRFSYDMLGEAARTMKDAERYWQSYSDAIREIAASDPMDRPIHELPSISVKLSALHPRYEARKQARVMDELYPRILALCVQAKEGGMALTIDAEEVDRLELSLKLFGRLAHDQKLKGWNGLGLAVQAYSRRAMPALEWLAQLARDTQRRFPVRLVKGAYWDTEIKLAQIGGYEGFPLFTRKVSTDVSYLACARYLLKHRDVFYPQFATHNAHTVAAVSVMAGNDREFEFQRLHGMGQALYDAVTSAEGLAQPCRIYAPVGSHEDLLAYLVRRLLENGANTSFVNRLADDEAPIEDIVEDPVAVVRGLDSLPHPRIAEPRAIFSPRTNSAGLPLWDDATRGPLMQQIEAALKSPVNATALVPGSAAGEKPRDVTSPHDRSVKVGTVSEASEAQVEAAIKAADKAQGGWDAMGGEGRAKVLELAADLYEQNAPKLYALLIREAGKTLDNAQADLREAVDFLRYYAAEAREKFHLPEAMPGPTGEHNELRLHGRGVFACIAPWNFPLAIFTGQMAAALAAGNAVLAKPAEQTPLIAYEAVRLMHQAGVPAEVLSLLPGDGARIGGTLLKHPLLGGVAFTGSTQTAHIINRAMAARNGVILPLIAETGGMNAMIVDSSALPEQAVRDLILSAFDSAGQRCSAARILFVQEEAAKRTIDMLCGAAAELKVGDPLDFSTDVGPVIDEEARERLEAHKARMGREAKTLIDLPMPAGCKAGTYVTPAIYELASLAPLKEEVFGPCVHVVRYKADKLDQVCEALNATGYGLTLGLHSRIEDTVEQVARKVRVGNMYVNRNQIGAIVGSQPFGGEGLSGTGPKAGGPHYLYRFAAERVLSVDTTASGGNAALMSMEVER
ncbi:MAG: bifunctional proline dehydrogenase/L-glutamate gamma-semialdehyde dehydrogenase PutA [Anderseniella sp.]|jgi:RHH-type proline utilization regulon transcriptional repressor/proline dehydrogenase/delta 1-pyrroline-5-carboxylate dehydrogenase|nr:bifunctional proline dehydrogenase/L-glutamate gamma-semialdehyde dehydrogenase PutA [Anderseniella sp.]